MDSDGVRNGVDVEGQQIRLDVGMNPLAAVLNDSSAAMTVWAALPIDDQACLWREDIHFDFPVQVTREDNATQVMILGGLGYGPTGSAFCIPFGKSPMSTDTKIRQASPVTMVGELEGNLDVLKTVICDERIGISRAHWGVSRDGQFGDRE